MAALGEQTEKAPLKIVEARTAGGGVSVSPVLREREVPAEREAMAAPPPAEAAAPPKRAGRRRLLLGAAALVALGVGGWYGHDYWTNGRFLVSTNDAYVGADMAAIAPKLAALVVDVPAVENARVKAGDVLLRLDPRDYRSALDQAEAKLTTQEATVERIATQMRGAEAGIAQAQAQIAAAQADVVRTEAALARAQTLSQNEFASRAALETATADRDRARAQRANTDAALASAVAARDLATAQRKEAEAGLVELRVLVEKARRDLDATTVVAPFDGVVAARAVQVGDYVSPGERVLSLVPIDHVYVDANFKETQIASIVPGEAVDVTVDAYPDRVFEGHVTGLAGGTGSTFALLPPDNATGNFTKIVQRLAVRIALPQPDDGTLLRPGMSVTATIDTRTAPATATAAR